MADLTDLILALRQPEITPEFFELHSRIEMAAKSGTLTDALLNECRNAECTACGELVCPHGEPLHFHHDGCPSCEGGPP